MAWTMTGPDTLASRIMGLFVDCDAMCGRMFEQGLAALKGARGGGGGAPRRLTSPAPAC